MVGGTYQREVHIIEGMNIVHLDFLLHLMITEESEVDMKDHQLHSRDPLPWDEEACGAGRISHTVKIVAVIVSRRHQNPSHSLLLLRASHDLHLVSPWHGGSTLQSAGSAWDYVSPSQVLVRASDSYRKHLESRQNHRSSLQLAFSCVSGMRGRNMILCLMQIAHLLLLEMNLHIRKRRLSRPRNGVIKIWEPNDPCPNQKIFSVDC